MNCSRKKTSYAPHHCRVAAEQAAEAALNGSSARKAPQGEAAKRLTIFAEKNEGSEFFSGKGKPMKQALHFFRAFLL
ncbi:MAG: hypothetical protein ACLTAN_10690 [Christensenellaceae bacterium]